MATVTPEQIEEVMELLGSDPYLQYRPSFAYSLPVQIFLQGITLTLLTVLLIHILFTTPYHWPLSRVNWILQVSGILCVMGSTVGSIFITLDYQDEQATIWPYMLDYISVQTPPDAWSQSQTAAWFVLQAMANATVSITHVQFLTLLYPSGMEVKLIFLILCPLVFASSGLTFTSLSSSRTTIDLGDAISGVFDSTLLLIFTASLILWGVFVNRNRAWRFDGGTAIFGGGAISLAIISTALNFVSVKEDGLNWLQNLLWAVVLWQSWLGFWWWVGSGMGIGEVEDMLIKEQRRKTRAEKKRRARLHSEAAPASTSDRRPKTSGGSVGGGSTSFPRTVMDRWRTPESGSQRRHRNTTGGGGEEGIELDEMAQSGSGDANQSARGRDVGIDEPDMAATRTEARTITTGSSDITTSSGTPELAPPTTVSNILSWPVTSMQIYFRRLRQDHEAATKKKALERVERRTKALGGDRGGGGQSAGGGSSNGDLARRLGRENTPTGWGLGSYGYKEAKAGGRRIGEARRRMMEGRLIPTPGGHVTLQDPPAGTTRRSNRLSGMGRRSRTRSPTPSSSDSETDMSDAENGTASRMARSPPVTAAETEGAWVDLESPREERRGSRTPGTPGRTRSVSPVLAPDGRTQVEDDGEDDEGEGRGRGWSWWGPFAKWRLADRTSY